MTCSEFHTYGIEKLKTKPTETVKKVRKSIKIVNSSIYQLTNNNK